MGEAAGRVCTGFSNPYVAKYAAAGGNVTYTEGMALARGVSVSIDPEVSDDDTFYANNAVAEEETGEFIKGTAKLTVDGLKDAAAQFIFGLPASEEYAVTETLKVKVNKYGAAAKPPYVGIGVIVRYKSAGVTSYVPTVLKKGRFKLPSTEAKTAEGTGANWQTQDLEAALMRDDSSNNDWKWEFAEQATEEAADNILRAFLSVAAVEG
ncbi:MAG: hypothetical protein IJO56_05910 [Oscillospiraceae bacterium]|nr:hypothetical protein [Oscillospiraceae bacterium]